MKISLLAAVSSASLMSAALAVAQSSRDVEATPSSQTQISFDQPIDHRLGRDSLRTKGDDAVVYADYRLRLEQGEAIRADLTSNDFDAYLELFREGQTEAEPLAFDDDGGPEGTDSRLRFTADTAGNYSLRVRPLTGVEGGEFRLLVVEQAARDYPKGPSLVVGETQTGSLNGQSPLDDDEARYAPHSWTAQAGERVALRLSSEDFDALLSLGQITNGRYVELDSNDDDGGGLDSRLIFTAPTASTYYIKALSTDPKAEGIFELIVEQGPKAAEVRNLAFDETVDGSLSDSTGLGFNNDPADQWRISGKAGQKIVAVLSSDDFDTYLELYDTEGETLGSDDDGAGDLNSRLVQTLPHDGDYILEARALSKASGDYDLKLTLSPPVPRPQVIRFGQTVEGELKSNSPIDDAGLTYAGYVFEGQADQRVQLIVRSGDFDAMSQIGKLPSEGGEFEVLQSDDDGLQQGTDSRLYFTLPEAGQYEVRALGLESESRGLYAVELMDRGPEPKPGSLLVPSVARGSLSDRDSLNDEGQSFDAYSFKVKADEKLRFTLISAEFDAVVEVGEMKNENWRSADSDDDSLSDTHARLDWTAPRDGTYQVRVRSYKPGATGTYSLMVERQP